MPITIKSSRMQYRKSNGDYVGVDAVSERKTSEFISAIESTGSTTQSAIEQTASTARDAIDTKAQQARDSIPSDYTELSDEVQDLKSALDDEKAARILADTTFGTHKIAQPLDEYNQPTDGTNGQLLRTKGDGSTEWVDEGLPTDEQTAQAVTDWLDNHPEATTTVLDKSLTYEKFVVGTFGFVMPEMYLGEQYPTYTEAFVAACNSGKPVYVTGGTIDSCNISSCKVVFNGTNITGEITGKSIDVSGSVEMKTNSGFVIARNVQEKVDQYRDDSYIHDLIATIDGCATFLKIIGTMYNVRVDNITLNGKCSQNAIVITTNPFILNGNTVSGWITTTLIRNSMLGSCDTPILINDLTTEKNNISNIRIENVIAQKLAATGPCRFITTNSRGVLYIRGSHMYDSGGVDDSQIYLVRDGLISNFIILYSDSNLSKLGGYIADDSGNKGGNLLQEISEAGTGFDGVTAFPDIIHRNPEFFTLETSGAGIAQDAVFSREKIIGRQFKVGRTFKTTSADKIVGVNIDTNKLSMAYREVNTQEDQTRETLTVRSYDGNEENIAVSTKAKIDRYGNGHPIFHTGLKKLVIKYGTKYYDAMGNQISEGDLG